jgi:hypothetical protein
VIIISAHAFKQPSVLLGGVQRMGSGKDATSQFLSEKKSVSISKIKGSSSIIIILGFLVLPPVQP